MTGLWFIIAIAAYAALGWMLVARLNWIKTIPIVGPILANIENSSIRVFLGLMTLLVVAFALAFGGALLTIAGELLLSWFGLIAYIALGWFVFTRPPEKIKYCGSIMTAVENVYARTALSVIALAVTAVVLAFGAPVLAYIGRILLTPITVPFGL